MSYILDALQKSQRDRDLGKIPTLTSEHFEQPARETGFSPLIISSVVVTMIAMAIAAYAIIQRPDHTEPAVSAPPVIPTKDLVETKPVKIELPKVSPIEPRPTVVEVVEEMPIAIPEPLEPVEAVNIEVQTTTVQKPNSGLRDDLAVYRQEMLDLIAEEQEQAIKQAIKASPTPVADTKPKPVKQPTSKLPDPVDKARHYPLQKNLPAAIAKRIPEQNVIVHVYSETPANRYVILNSTRMSEGDKASNGLKVLEIRQSGLVLDFEGHKFFSPR